MSKILFYKHIVFVFVWFITSWSVIFAQDIPIIGDTSSSTLTDTFELVKKDTLSNNVYYFGIYTPFDTLKVVDTLIDEFYEYDLIRNTDLPYINTGNVGSSSFPMFYFVPVKRKTAIGIERNSLYKYGEKDMVYYDIEKPYGDLAYYSGESQASFRSVAHFARTFGNGQKLSIHFNRINTEDNYLHQNVRHTNLHMGMFHKIDSTDWAYTINFISNSNYEDLNGGIEHDSFFDRGVIDIKSNIPVRSEDQYTYQLQRKYLMGWYRFLGTQHNSFLYAECALENSLYKNIDPDISTFDSTYLPREWLVSELGLRHHIRTRSLGTKLAWQGKRNNGFLSLSTQYLLNRISEESRVTYYNDMIAEMKLGQKYGFLHFDLESSVGMVTNYFMVYVLPNVRVEWNEFLQVGASFLFHIRPPDLIENSLILTDTSIYQQSLKSSKMGVWNMYLQVPRYRAKVQLEMASIADMIYLDTVQWDFDNFPNYQYTRLSISKETELYWIYLKNEFYWQKSNVQWYNAPALLTRNTLAVKKSLFGDKLKTKVGAVVDFAPSYVLPKYNQWLDRLYYSNQQETKEFLRLDVFATIQVQSFRFYIKYENLSDLWSNRIYYQIHNYPQMDGRLRLGVRWIMRY